MAWVSTTESSIRIMLLKGKIKGEEKRLQEKCSLITLFPFFFYLLLSSPRELEVVEELYGFYEYSMLGCVDYFDELVATCNLIVYYYFEFWFLF